MQDLSNSCFDRDDGSTIPREASVGQSFQDSGAKLMSIVNDTQVLATANIYEKDLGQVRLGQKVNVRVASLPDRLFTGTINRIGTVVRVPSQQLIILGCE